MAVKYLICIGTYIVCIECNIQNIIHIILLIIYNTNSCFLFLLNSSTSTSSEVIE